MWLQRNQERQRVAAHQLRVESVPPEPDADALGKPRVHLEDRAPRTDTSIRG